MAKPTVRPFEFSGELLSGFGTQFEAIGISNIPSSAQMNVSIVMDGAPPFEPAVDQIRVFRTVSELVFPDEDDFPGDIPPEPQIIEREVLERQSNGIDPILVEVGQHARIRIAVPHVATSFGSATGTLKIFGDGWDEIAVPLIFTEGPVLATSLRRFPNEIRQGNAATCEIEVAWRSGPATNASFNIKMTDGIGMVPVTLNVQPLENMRAEIALHVADDCELGSRFIGIEGRGGAGDVLFECAILPPPAPPELDPAAKRALFTQKIDQLYRETGGPKGKLGYPVSPVKIDGTLATRSYNGGKIHALLRPTTGEPNVDVRAAPEFEVQVIWRGFRCDRESDHDQTSDTDEPYFVLSVEDISGTVPRMQLQGPFENVRSGTEVPVNRTLVQGLAPTYFRIGVRAFESDFGDPNETAANLQNEAVKLAREVERIAALAGAASADGPGLGPAAGAGLVSGLFAGPFGALAAAGIVAVLDLGDDFIGESSFDLFERREERRQGLPKLGRFGGEPYNVIVPIDGGSEGVYTLFFDVILQPIPILPPL